MLNTHTGWEYYLFLLGALENPMIRGTLNRAHRRVLPQRWEITKSRLRFLNFLNWYLEQDHSLLCNDPQHLYSLNRVSKYMKQKLIELQGEINKSIIIVRDFNTHSQYLIGQVVRKLERIQNIWTTLSTNLT